MRKIISFVHLSLDGYVAGPNGEMDWIKINQEIFDHVGARIGRCDAALYGRVTYDMMEAYWPTATDKPNASKHDKEHSLWYSKAHKLVLSRSMEGADLPNTSIISHNLLERIQEIKQQPGPEILLFGSPSATHALMELGLIDGYWLFVNPIALGTGIPLFKNIPAQTPLQLTSTRVFGNGVVELCYEVGDGEVM